MTKDEILEKSRKENKGMDERELQSMYQSGYFSHAFGLFLCSTVTLINRHYGGPKSVNDAVYFVTFGMFAAYVWGLAQKTGKKYYWVMMIVSILLSVISVFQFITHVRAGT